MCLQVETTTGITLNKIDDVTVQKILGTIYGQCAGDAIGLLTEFLTKEEANEYYKSVSKELEYEHKDMVRDLHRINWKVGDWTDDSDQMILILLSIVENNGKVDYIDFGRRLHHWVSNGYPELGDTCGSGLGRTTETVVNHPNYCSDPHAVADMVWADSGKYLAPNGAVMRTSILGIHMFSDIDAVKQNAISVARTTHADPRCQASAVAVCVAIALMLQRQPKHMKIGDKYNIKAIIKDCYNIAAKCLETDEQKRELLFYLLCEKLNEIKLYEGQKIGYTYKSLGSAFWALKQDNFRNSIQEIVMEGGDADTNACVAGALLGCKLGLEGIPESWRNKLIHKDWLQGIIDRYFQMMGWNSKEK